MRRRRVQSLVHNVVNGLVSRNSDDEGYWIFGRVAAHVTELQVDLLAETAFEPPVIARFARLARARFHEQLARNGGIPRLRSASLHLTSSAPIPGTINGHPVTGRDLTVSLRAVTEHGAAFAHERTIFVAPHDPTLEWRRSLLRA